MVVQVAEWIGFQRRVDEVRHLDADVRVLGESRGVCDLLRHLSLLRDGGIHAHVIDDERQIRVALRDWSEPVHVAERQEHDGKPVLLGRRPEPVSGAVGEPGERFGSVERHAHAEHARLILPPRQERSRLRILQRDAAHDREAAGIAPDGFQRIAVYVVEGRRHEDDAIHAGRVHQRNHALDSERFGQLRSRARVPGVVRTIRFPQVHLRVDDHALSHGLRGARARAGCQRHTGAERRSQEFASCEHGCSYVTVVTN